MWYFGPSPPAVPFPVALTPVLSRVLLFSQAGERQILKAVNWRFAYIALFQPLGSLVWDPTPPPEE